MVKMDNTTPLTTTGICSYKILAFAPTAWLILVYSFALRTMLAGGSVYDSDPKELGYFQHDLIFFAFPFILYTLPITAVLTAILLFKKQYTVKWYVVLCIVGWVSLWGTVHFAPQWWVVWFMD